MKPHKTLLRLAALVAVLAVNISLLLAVRKSSWLPAPDRILASDPEEAIYGMIWLVAASATGWIAVSCAASTFAFVFRSSAAIRATRLITLKPIHALAANTAALLLAVYVASTPVQAAEAPPTPHLVEASAVDEHRAVSPATPEASRTTDEELGGTPPPPVPHLVARPDGLSSAGPVGKTNGLAHVVKPGDHLWSITALHLGRQLGHRPSNAAIAPLWRDVVRMNQDRLASGDPNLIFPGETILLPELGGSDPPSPGGNSA